MVSGDIVPRAYGFRPLSGSQSVATSHESQTHQTLSSSGREKETVVLSSNGRGIEIWAAGLTVDEKVLREEEGFVRGAKLWG
jgi:hypothetical protein